MSFCDGSIWKGFSDFSAKCENNKTSRGGAWCVIDGVTGYCDPYGCPKWKK